MALLLRDRDLQSWDQIPACPVCYFEILINLFQTIMMSLFACSKCAEGLCMGYQWKRPRSKWTNEIGADGFSQAHLRL